MARPPRPSGKRSPGRGRDLDYGLADLVETRLRQHGRGKRPMSAATPPHGETNPGKQRPAAAQRQPAQTMKRKPINQAATPSAAKTGATFGNARGWGARSEPLSRPTSSASAGGGSCSPGPVAGGCRRDKFRRRGLGSPGGVTCHSHGILTSRGRLSPSWGRCRKSNSMNMRSNCKLISYPLLKEKMK